MCFIIVCENVLLQLIEELVKKKSEWNNNNNYYNNSQKVICLFSWIKQTQCLGVIDVIQILDPIYKRKIVHLLTKLETPTKNNVKQQRKAFLSEIQIQLV